MFSKGKENFDKSLMEDKFLTINGQSSEIVFDFILGKKILNWVFCIHESLLSIQNPRGMILLLPMQKKMA